MNVREPAKRFWLGVCVLGVAGDIRPQEFWHRINTPSLRGVNIQRLFGSQRALKTVEYFNLIQQLHLTAPEKKDLVAFMRCL